MNETDIHSVTVLGSGNVATHVAGRLFAQGCRVVQVCSRTLAHAQALAQQVRAQATDRPEHLLPAQAYILAVSDDAIAEVAATLPAGDALVVHTSGATDCRVLENFSRYGVLYPLQTFSRARTNMDWEQVPVLVEANTPAVLDAVKQLARKLSPEILEADSAQRLQWHLAAVFACNFVNYLLGAAADLCAGDFRKLHPLVRETIAKAFAARHPREVQTGPAVRGDRATMDNHLRALPASRQELYRLLSTMIQEKYHG